MTVDIELNSKSPMLHHQKVTMANFITGNFRKSNNDKSISFEAQIKRNEDDVSLSQTDAYGVLRLENVCDISYMKPKYLRFAPTKNCCEKLRELLLNKWYFKKPNLLALTYGTTSFDNKSVKELVSFVNLSNGWFISTDEFNDSVPYHCLLNRKQNMLSDDNLIMLQDWSSAVDEGLIVKGDTGVNQAVYGYTGDKNKRDAAREHSVFLFSDIVTQDSVLESELKLIYHLSRSFNKDGHHEECKPKGFDFHVTPVIIFWVDEDDVLNYSEEKQNTLMILLKSNLPLVIGGKLAEFNVDTIEEPTTPTFIKELKKGLEGTHVVCWVESDSQFISEIVVKLLLKSRLDGLPRGLQSDYNETVSAIYHTMCFKMEDECRKLIGAVPPKAKGLKEYIMSMLLYYESFALLDYCFYCGYDIATFLNNTYANLTKSSNNKHDILAELTLIDNLTKGNTDFEHNRNEEWFKYLKFCADEKWGVARMLRRHLPNPIMKCLLAIQIAKDILEKRKSNPLLGRDHCKQIQLVIDDIEDEAKEIISICNTQQFDLNLIIFKRYTDFCNNTILSLAVENDCKKLFMVETNVHMCITNRWNGKLESDHHNSMNNPMALFLKDKDEDFVSREGWCERARRLVKSPRLKCCNLVLVYIAFIALMTIILLESKRTLTLLDGIAVLFVISFIFVEISQMFRSKKKTVLTRVRCYFKSTYNIVDLISALCVIVYFVLKLSGDDNNDLAQFLMSVGFLGYIIRFTQFLQMYEKIGPKLITIKGMLSDLVFFACFLLLSMISYGIVSEYLISPSSTNITVSMVPKALFRPYINLFGELGLDTLEDDISSGVCRYEYGVNNTGVNSTEEYCHSYKCDDSTRCSSHRVIAKCLLGLYMIVTVILLLNLLIAIFSKTYEDNDIDTYSSWQMQRYTLITEFETQFILPLPPFNILNAIWIIFSRRPATEGFDYYSEHIDNFERRANNIYHKEKK